MATIEQITQLRQMTNEPEDATTYTDPQLSSLIDLHGSLDAAAAQVWQVKAARYSELTDVQEGSSRRALGDLYDQALKMASHYAGQAATVAPRRPARVSRIVRP